MMRTHRLFCAPQLTHVYTVATYPTSEARESYPMFGGLGLCSDICGQVDSDDEEEESESETSPAPRKAANKRRRLERSLPGT
jgi:hypothetical protein